LKKGTKILETKSFPTLLPWKEVITMKKIKRKHVSKIFKRTRDRAISVLDKARKGLISMNPDLRLPIVL